MRVGLVGAVVLAALIAFFASGCGTVKPPGPTPLPPAPVDPSGATCETACARIEELGCGGGPRCVPACENVQASGVFAYDVGCLTRAQDCAAVDACYRQ